MIKKYYIHASPTLFNSGLQRPQLSSCFLIQMHDDSISGIYKTLTDAAKISQHGGGISISVSNIRCQGSTIGQQCGESQGIIQMLKIFNESCKYVTQSQRRKGAMAIYLEPHHPDIIQFLQLRKNTGNYNMRCPDLFIGVYISDLFMQRVKDDELWSLFCPSKVPQLFETYGEEYNKIYLASEQQQLYQSQIKARIIFDQIIQSQIDSGMPYVVYKDQVNRASNQNNLGTIKQSNLCVEIAQYSSKDETAVCNLASINLGKYVSKGQFNHVLLGQHTEQLVENLDNIIDMNYYPTEETRRSNLKHRPMSIGIQGLANCFIKMNIAFESQEAKQLNIDIFETIYYHALQKSVQLSKIYGPYETFQNSQFSKGILQFDNYKNNNWEQHLSQYNWQQLKMNIIKYGTRNSLLTGLMPTQSVSQILGSTESFEPYTSNIFNRRTLHGEFIFINKYLIKNLQKLQLYDEKMKLMIINNNGSIQNIDEVPKQIKKIYKTNWEISQKKLIELAADRQLFIDQSQSLNIFMINPNKQKLQSLHFYTWQQGLKSGLYYLRQYVYGGANQIQNKINEQSQQENKYQCQGCQ